MTAPDLVQTNEHGSRPRSAQTITSDVGIINGMGGSDQTTPVPIGHGICDQQGVVGGKNRG